MSEVLHRLATSLSDRYRVERELGAGGMATVYLAEDVRHHRKVALKVLHPELAAVIGADRFLTEIATTATLQHPGILPLFDSGAADGLVYYVMPFVRGESLRQRLDRERQLPLDDALKIAGAVAGALDYAHRQGIIHRDIKPENILLQDGHALVADFGIALAVTNAGGVRLTQTGLSLGTPQYMSPEQASGERSLDGRTDIYSLGAVCYEMLAGEPPFVAATFQAIIARILTEEPRLLSSLRRSVPNPVEIAIHRALEKLPADRWSSAGDFAAALAHPDAHVLPLRTRPSRSFPPVMVAGIGGLALLAGIGLGGLLGRFPTRTASGPATVRRWSIPLPDAVPFAPTSSGLTGTGHAIAISPNGDLVAYAGQRDGTPGLELVRLVDGSVTPLPGTRGARLPVFSPDNRWLAFIADGEVRKISVEGGAVVRLGLVDAPTALFWLSDERLMVSRSALGPATVASSGGRLEPLGARFQASSFVHTQLLPDGKHLLGTTAYGDMATISLETGALRFITTGDFEEQDRAEFGRALRGNRPRYLASGHLIYVAGSSLMAVPFDAAALRVTGKPTPIASDVRSEGGPGDAHFAVSDEGTLVYAARPESGGGTLIWADRHGVAADSVPARAANVLSFVLSRDGRKLAIVERLPSSPAETRIVDLVRRVEDRARLEGEFGVAAWTSNSRALLGYFVPDTARARACCFSGAEVDAGTLMLRETAGPARYKLMIEFDESPDGRLRCSGGFEANRDRNEFLMLRRTDGQGAHRPVARGVPGDCRFSPDGRWVAYTGNDGLSVTRAVLDDSKTFRLVPGASTQARWTPEGGEILYRNGRGLYVIGVRRIGEEVEASEPRLLFERDGLFTTWDVWGNGWDLAPDGRLLLWQGPAQETETQLKAITSLGTLLVELLPPQEPRRP